MNLPPAPGPAMRNRGPILEVLRPLLPPGGATRKLLAEIASGSGTHMDYFAQALPWVDFQPSDAAAAALAGLAARFAAAGRPANIRAPVPIDVMAAAWWTAWPAASLDAMLCINMVHIAPWQATLGLLEGAGALVKPGGFLLLYGPYRRDGAHTAPSNAAFDADLRARNPLWGIRDLEQVEAAAQRQALHLEAINPMPANNFTLVLRRR